MTDKTEKASVNQVSITTLPAIIISLGLMCIGLSIVYAAYTASHTGRRNAELRAAVEIQVITHMAEKARWEAIAAKYCELSKSPTKKAKKVNKSN